MCVFREKCLQFICRLLDFFDSKAEGERERERGRKEGDWPSLCLLDLFAPCVDMLDGCSEVSGFDQINSLQFPNSRAFNVISGKSEWCIMPDSVETLKVKASREKRTHKREKQSEKDKREKTMWGDGREELSLRETRKEAQKKRWKRRGRREAENPGPEWRMSTESGKGGGKI